MRTLLIAALLLAVCADAAAQNKKPQRSDPRQRRAQREKAVELLNTEAARPFVETLYGDEACLAIFACSLPVAQKLAEFHASGKLDKLARPRELLFVIGKHGNEVALYAIAHASELQDADALDAFLVWPLEIALKLRSLDDAAKKVNAWRKSASRDSALTWNGWLVGIGAVIIIGLIFWRRHRLAGN